ncbi:MFS transporter [Stutzerimonas nosocomialis]|uniref:MFS transporter n=1 Tax=Stutzerimonas nosocomialis TaxID=1056496 RepID=A0A5R9QIW5_9GAMM|nr:MFS transporter [Stutzerimonas nosocomialis]TLX57165.1 MFS transporter [Stutzerimonas nosocomialis]TLX65211.1 MFS transporter [Stutzerimonas nosocomialis]
MDALLIIGGLLLMLAGFVWLVSRAFGTSLLWGVGSLVPPITLAYIFTHWQTARRAVILAILGVAPLIVGFSMLASRDTERLEAILSLSWLEPEVQPDRRLDILVRGELSGQPFMPQLGEIAGNTLVLREGKDFLSNQEISIRFAAPIAEGPLRLDVLPGDAEPLPEIAISWLRPDQELPEARRIARGYTLHLDLSPVPPNKLVGDFHLVLPQQYQTSVSGRVEVYRNQLRYRDGVVDRRHDSVDTLRHVIQDHLERRFATRDVTFEPVTSIALPAVALELEVKAALGEKTETLTLALAKGPSGWAVEGDEYPALASSVAPQAKPVVRETPAPVPAEKPAAPAVDRRKGFSLETLLAKPERYRHLQVRAHTERGGVADGRFNGLDGSGNLLIRRVLKGPGEAFYNLAPSEIVLLELMEP